VSSGLLWFWLTVHLVGGVARCESNPWPNDAAVVVQVLVNRAHNSGRPLTWELLKPAQFAWTCPSSPRTWSKGHLLLGVQAVLGGSIPGVPTWAHKARFFTSPIDRPGMCKRWRARVIGSIVHTFCGPALKPTPAPAPAPRLSLSTPTHRCRP
jgi:hypothetical protein